MAASVACGDTDKAIFLMKVSKSNMSVLVLFLGGLIGGLFATFESFVAYMDTAPIDEKIRQSLLNSITSDAVLHIFVYTILGILASAVVLLLHYSINRARILHNREPDSNNQTFGE